MSSDWLRDCGRAMLCPVDPQITLTASLNTKTKPKVKTTWKIGRLSSGRMNANSMKTPRAAPASVPATRARTKRRSLLGTAFANPSEVAQAT